MQWWKASPTKPKNLPAILKNPFVVSTASSPDTLNKDTNRVSLKFGWDLLNRFNNT